MSSINLLELNQKLDRLIQNIAEQNRRAYQIFYDPTPQDVTLPQLDENGNLVNVTIPNRAKIKAQVDNFIAGAEANIKGWWDIETRVSNSDELENVLNSLPKGASAYIKLNTGTYTISNTVELTNNTVFFDCYPADSVEINFSTHVVEPSLERPFNLLLENSNLFVYGYGKCTINTSTKNTNNEKYNEPNFMIRGSGSVGFWNTKIICNDYALVGGYGSVGTLNFIVAELSSCEVIKHDAPLLTINNVGVISRNGGSIKDSSGNTLSLSDVIENIVRDSNGNPRNIVSNEVL